MLPRNLVVLFLCQLISSTGAIVIVTLGGIIGSSLTDNQALATLPVSLMVIMTAVTTVPATMLMRAIGRKAGSAAASLSACAAVLLAGYALSVQSFGVFMAAGATFGINMAFTQQYRYAAAESVEPKYGSRAISLVLVGAIGGALIGPELVTRLQYWFPQVQYLGTLVAVAGMYVLQAMLFLILGPMRGDDAASRQQHARPLGEIARQPVFIMAVLGGTMSYGVMTFIMTATPLSMHVHDGHSLDVTANVIRSHVLGMYVPSLFTGFLIERFGTVKIMSVGALALLSSCIIGLQGQGVLHYWYALILLGVGWNFLYVGSTAMLTFTYTMSERFKSQAVNEFCVFGTSAAGSLLAGTVIHLYGWLTLVTVPIPALVLILLGLYSVRKNALVKRPVANVARA
jgi:MFS family permease